ncbi:hypothetical protein LWP59_27630 [Amycolatopsis acidiphila]|uniref:Uncharacterized protein n=1 Tax=Amycolatopsis acidiphila TaxID=715473 RepID=A0A558A134_9PSEU|nr:hypothetical protein [Amycolatopsis acidiphila]TVT17964.1 hypothetical protein FNH06_29525 [Amycolatopsis acidiphila]UIJ57864.1 hypothetical protein LWP59_27510 [Amycolatopsis acidiphila]UIJ57887.1 hypothetical protein LWP59_27630 [Amycolatopsis acidiphila]GHG71329.1 hypothetical protein GCM10017788_33170 [Amycolatopsis acidiphila]
MTRYLISDPGAAHPAKNATAPGLPNQPGHDSKGRALMVSQELLSRASRRTGYRKDLVAAPVQIIAGRHAEGHSVGQITRYLKDQLGPDNTAAARTFVAWVIAAAERGEVA